MEESKLSLRPLRQRIDTGNVNKKRSPYQLQYMQYEKRQANKARIRLPSLRLPSRNGPIEKKMNNKEYLAWISELRSNTNQPIFQIDKQNTSPFQTEQCEELIDIKGLLNRMKGRSVHTQESRKNKAFHLQYSQQMSMNSSNVRSDQENIFSRSRALSNNLNPLKERDENAGGGVKFLDYKKSRMAAKF